VKASSHPLIHDQVTFRRAAPESDLMINGGQGWR
jgi:hypothetical protein